MGAISVRSGPGIAGVERVGRTARRARAVRGLFAVAAVLALGVVVAGCGNGTPGYASSEAQMNKDAQELSRAIAGTVIVRNGFRRDTCTNDGDGSVPPSTRIELILRGSRTEGQLRSAAATEMRALGYTVDGEANPQAGDGGSNVLIAGSRALDGDRESKLVIHLSEASTYDFILESTLAPAITC